MIFLYDFKVSLFQIYAFKIKQFIQQEVLTSKLWFEGLQQSFDCFMFIGFILQFSVSFMNIYTMGLHWVFKKEKKNS